METISIIWSKSIKPSDSWSLVSSLTNLIFVSSFLYGGSGSGVTDCAVSFLFCFFFQTFLACRVAWTKAIHTCPMCTEVLLYEPWWHGMEGFVWHDALRWLFFNHSRARVVYHIYLLQKGARETEKSNAFLLRTTLPISIPFVTKRDGQNMKHMLTFAISTPEPDRPVS